MRARVNQAPTMLDTVRLGAWVGRPLDPGRLLDQGWSVRSDTTNVQGEQVQSESGFAERDGVRLFWRSPDWVAAETSLPKAATGDNANFLNWSQCVSGFETMREAAADATGADLPPTNALFVQRFDVLGAWPVSPGPYIDAARQVHLAGLTTRTFPTSVAWCTRAGGVKVRLYDKGAESGHAVGLPLRLETQVRRPARYVYRGASGERVGRLVADWSGEVAMDVLRGTVGALGLDRAVPDRFAARSRLIEQLGWTRGIACWAFLRDASELGAPELACPDDQRRWRLLRDARKAGVLAVVDDQLPGLDVGGAGHLPY